MVALENAGDAASKVHEKSEREDPDRDLEGKARLERSKRWPTRSSEWTAHHGDRSQPAAEEQWARRFDRHGQNVGGNGDGSQEQQTDVSGRLYLHKSGNKRAYWLSDEG